MFAASTVPQCGRRWTGPLKNVLCQSVMGHTTTCQHVRCRRWAASRYPFSFKFDKNYCLVVENCGPSGALLLCMIRWNKVGGRAQSGLSVEETFCRGSTVIYSTWLRPCSFGWRCYGTMSTPDAIEASRKIPRRDFGCQAGPRL